MYTLILQKRILPPKSTKDVAAVAMATAENHGAAQLIPSLKIQKGQTIHEIDI